MKKFPPHLAFLGLLIAPLVQGTDQPLDEVVVEVARGKLFQEMVKLEEKFFDRYNELNTNDDFDTHCNLETRAGTRVERRYCRAVYQTRALQTEASEYLLFLQKNAPGLQEPGDLQPPPSPLIAGPPLPSYLEIGARQKDYQENIREVVRQHPELIELLRERYELAIRYERTRSKTTSAKPPAGNEAATAAPLLP